jgi:hypothetical protein
VTATVVYFQDDDTGAYTFGATFLFCSCLYVYQVTFAQQALFLDIVQMMLCATAFSYVNVSHRWFAV